MSDLVPQGPIPRAAEQNDLARLANNLSKSRTFKDANAPLQALAKIMFGRDLGIGATAALTGIDIIEGKPEVNANLQAQFVNTYVGPDGERYRYRVREHTDEKCRIEFFEREAGGEWETLGCSEFTMLDAARAKLAHKDNWKKYPRNMLFARAMSDGTAFLCPQVCRGFRVYHSHEIDVDGGLSGQQASAAAVKAVEEVEVVDGQVVEPQQIEAPAPVVISDTEVENLCEAIGEAGVKDPWLAKILVALGVQDVSGSLEERLGRLTPDQARELTHHLNGVVDEQNSKDQK